MPNFFIPRPTINTLTKTSLSIAIATSTLLAGGSAVADTNTEIEKLKQRIEQLETHRTHHGDKQDAHSEANHHDEDNDIDLSISGVIEVEAGYATDYDNNKSSDIVLATVAVAFEANVADNVNVQVAFLHEEDDTDLEVDEAHISFTKDNVFLNAGLIYVPFGGFASNLVSDPLTLELGETRESTVEMGIELGQFVASAYVFNGDIDDNGNADESKTEMYGLSFSFAAGNDDFFYELGADYINSIADTDNVQTTLKDGAGTIDDYVAGISLDATLALGAANLNIEYTSALDNFKASELIFDGDGAKPAAFNVEVGYVLHLMDCETQLAASYQGTKEALALGLPKTRIAFAASTLLANNTSLSLEFARDTDYSESKNGTGDTADMITAQLAVVF